MIPALFYTPIPAATKVSKCESIQAQRFVGESNLEVLEGWLWRSEGAEEESPQKSRGRSTVQRAWVIGRYA